MKKIRKATFVEVDACERCEQKEAEFIVCLSTDSVDGTKEGVIASVIKHLCKPCRDLVASKFTIRRKAKREKSDDSK